MTNEINQFRNKEKSDQPANDQSTLWPVDANAVLQIPLARFDLEDFVAWRLTKTGCFTVRSAYHLTWECQFGSRGSTTADQNMVLGNYIWAGLWELKVPAKIKIFLWKALHGAIPCRAVLANRHFKVSGQCPMCNAGMEDIRHMLFLCPRACEV